MKITNRRVTCWAHLKRDFEIWKLRGSESERIADLLLTQVPIMFGFWHQVRAGMVTRAKFKEKMESVIAEVRMLLVLRSNCGHKKTIGTSKELLKQFDSLWTFVKKEGVEPTNNSAERALRPAVIYRKRYFGLDERSALCRTTVECGANSKAAKEKDTGTGQKKPFNECSQMNPRHCCSNPDFRPFVIDYWLNDYKERKLYETSMKELHLRIDRGLRVRIWPSKQSL